MFLAMKEHSYTKTHDLSGIYSDISAKLASWFSDTKLSVLSTRMRIVSFPRKGNFNNVNFDVHLVSTCGIYRIWQAFHIIYRFMKRVQERAVMRAFCEAYDKFWSEVHKTMYYMTTTGRIFLWHDTQTEKFPTSPWKSVLLANRVSSFSLCYK